MSLKFQQVFDFTGKVDMKILKMSKFIDAFLKNL